MRTLAISPHPLHVLALLAPVFRIGRIALVHLFALVSCKRIVSMLIGMFRSCHRDQILRTVVSAISIDVVHDVARLKLAAIRFFPNKSMLQDIAADIREVVVGSIYKPVAARGSLASAFPTGGSLADPVMTVDVLSRLTSEVSISKVGHFCNWGAAATATAAKAGMYLLGGRFRSGFSFHFAELLRVLEVAIDVFDRSFSVLVKRVNRNFLVASTLTNSHGLRFSFVIARPLYNKRLSLQGV